MPERARRRPTTTLYSVRPRARCRRNRSPSSGASERARWPSEIFANLREFGYPGRIALINPRQTQVFGERCFPSLRELPEPVDHALVIVPAAAVPGVLTDAEAAGVKSATVYASMMGDGEDPESQQRGAWLKEFVADEPPARRRPELHGRLFLSRARCSAIPTPSCAGSTPGPVACIFQSGGLIQFWMKSAADRGLRFSYCITSGNEPDLGLADYLNFVIDDPQTRQVVLFIEGIRRPEAFMHAAGRALAMGKPILAIKTGATAKSQAASQSHTGAIAGDYAAYLAMCERYGIVNCRSLDDLVEAALAFDGGRLPKGPRIGFVTTSGATVDLLYDYAEAEGAAMPDFTRRHQGGAAADDAGGHRAEKPARRRHSLDHAGRRRYLRDRGARSQYRHGGVGVAHAAQGRRLGRRDAAAAAAGQDRQADRRLRPHDPPGQRRATSRRSRQRAFPFLQGIEPTIRALNGLWFHAARRGRAPAAPPPAPRERAFAGDARRDARALRHRAAEERGGRDRGRGGRGGAERIGFPVALKIRSRDILHKTEAGGVALDLREQRGGA